MIKQALKATVAVARVGLPEWHGMTVREARNTLTIAEYWLNQSDCPAYAAEVGRVAAALEGVPDKLTVPRWARHVLERIAEVTLNLALHDMTASA